MAVVHGDDDAAVRAGADDGDAGVLDGAEETRVEAVELGQVRVDDTAMTDDGHDLRAVGGHDAVDGAAHPSAERGVALRARDRVPATRVRERDPLRVTVGGAPAELATLPVAEEHLAQVAQLGDVEPARS